MKYEEWLAHFNPNHDPKNGQFTSNNNSSSGETSNKHGLTDSQKKAILIGSAAIASALLIYGGIYISGSKMSYPHPPIADFRFGNKINLSKFSDNDLLIPTNKKISRISTKPIEEYVEKGKTAYAAINKSDIALYKTALPKMSRPGIERDSTYYEHKWELKRPVKVMSRRKAAEVFIDLFGRDDAGTYRRFCENLITRTNPDTTKFFDEIKKMGYDAIIDENDSGWAKSPLIILEPASIIKSTKVHALGKHEKAISAWIANLT